MHLLSGTIFDDPTQLAVTLAVLFVAQTVYSLYGFGAGLLSVATLAFVIPDLGDVVALLLLVSLPTEIAIVWGRRRDVLLRDGRVLLVGIALGIPVGVFLLRSGADDPWLVQILGASLVAIALFFLFEERLEARTRSLPRGSRVGAGLASGVLAGLFGTGGPPLIFYLRAKRVPKDAFRVTLLALFLVTGVVRVPLYAATGLVDVATLLSALAVLPACLAGLFLGHRLHRVVPEADFRRGVSVLLGILGVLMLVRA